MTSTASQGRAPPSTRHLPWTLLETLLEIMVAETDVLKDLIALFGIIPPYTDTHRRAGTLALIPGSSEVLLLYRWYSDVKVYRGDHGPFLPRLFFQKPVTKTKSADSAPCSREDGDEKMKKSNRKTLAQDMKMRLSFLRRRHTDSSLQPSVRPSPEEASKWAESFQELTNNKYGLTLFRAFLSREFSEENIDFWLACEDYKRCRPNKLQAKARKIYEDFVAVQAPKEVNLDHSMRAAIYNHIQNADRHSFDCAQRRIQGLMEQDAYGRFLQSDLYKDLTQGNSTNTSS